MLNNYLHLFFLNKGANHWPQSQGGCSLGGIPSFAAFKFSGKSGLSSLCCQWNEMNTPKTSEGRASFASFVSTKWAGNWYLSLEQTWVRGRNPKTCFLTTQSRTDCKHFFNYILLCVATLFFLYLVSKYESCNGFILYCHSWKRIVYGAASRRGLFFKSLLICESFDRNVLFYLPELSFGFCPGSFLQLH